MREMTKTERKEIEFKVSEIMRSAVSSEYSRYILEQEDDVTGNTFMEDVIKNVMETSAWEDEAYPRLCLRTMRHNFHLQGKVSQSGKYCERISCRRKCSQ